MTENEFSRLVRRIEVLEDFRDEVNLAMTSMQASNRIPSDAMREMIPRVARFVEDFIDKVPGVRLPCGELFRIWTLWCQGNGFSPGKSPRLGRILRKVIPEIETRQGYGGKPEVRYYLGIRLKGNPEDDGEDVPE